MLISENGGARPYKEIDDLQMEVGRLRRQIIDQRTDQERLVAELRAELAKPGNDAKARQSLHTQVTKLRRLLKDSKRKYNESLKQRRLLEKEARGRLEYLMTLATTAAEMPSVPPSTLKVTDNFESLLEGKVPSDGGIYFVWNNEHVVYVGKSTCLRKRLDRNHHAIRPGDSLSWLHFHVAELDWAECFYIWRCRPKRNFGSRASSRHVIDEVLILADALVSSEACTTQVQPA